MTDDWIGGLQGSLIELGSALGISLETLRDREELSELRYENLHMPRDLVRGLSLKMLRSVATSYGEALTCSLFLGDLEVLAMKPELSQSDLDACVRQSKSSPVLTARLKVNKTALVEKRIGVWPGCQIYVCLFAQTLENLLTGSVTQIENLLWRDGSKKVIVLVGDRDICLNGPYLAIVGGRNAATWRSMAQEPALGPIHRLQETSRAMLHWQERWVRHLTPIHLKFSEQRGATDDAIARTLHGLLLNLSILYTADQSFSSADGKMRALYTGARQSVEVMLPTFRDLPTSISRQETDSLIALVEWAYNETWSTDRLPLVQIAMGQMLQSVELSRRHEALLLNAGNILGAVQWHWKALVESKVENYVAQVKILEDYVTEIVGKHADEISEMVDSLSKTMLAAVAAIAGSFIAALFRDTFNTAVFRFGVIGYAAYVLIFPLLFGMLNSRQEYEALVEAFDTRCERFMAQLYPDKVREIVGSQIDGSRERFRKWSRAVGIAYLLIIVVLVVSALWIPELIGPANI